ncbi:hypothetical protein, partial [Pantoea septica]|uniref:hypothetical protein n=1 Tax=Pantoea septica TaxID=472695 RepID=UPI00289AF744
LSLKRRFNHKLYRVELKHASLAARKDDSIINCIFVIYRAGKRLIPIMRSKIISDGAQNVNNALVRRRQGINKTNAKRGVKLE